MVNLKKKTKQTQLGALIILAKLQRDAHMVDVKFELCKPLTDQYQYLGNCSPTPPLTQQQSIDNKLRLMLS